MNERLTNFCTWARRYFRLSFFATLAVLIYVCFFNGNTVVDTYVYEREIDMKRAEIAANLDTIRYYENLLNMLQTDPETMERIVREQYHMQRPNEDIYVVE